MQETDKAGADAAFARRMEWVEQAYQAFRDKWDATLAGTYAQLKSRDFLTLARRNADRIALKCELPPSVLQDVEFH